LTKRYTKHIINRVKAYGVLKKGANMKGAKSNNRTIGICEEADTYEDALIKVKGEEGYQRIEQKDILFIEADRSCTLVYTKDEVYRSSISLTKWKEVLNPALFIRCHRSYIVNKVKIARVGEDECTLCSGERVLISRQIRELLGLAGNPI